MHWLVFVLLASLVATCGQKGPLSLPEEEAAHTGSAAAAAVRTAATDRTNTGGSPGQYDLARISRQLAAADTDALPCAARLVPESLPPGQPA